MCKALEELMKDELEAKKTEGEEIGEERVNELTLKLSKLGRDVYKRQNLHRWFSDNYNVEVHAYVKNGKYCVVNNTYEPQDTTVYKGCLLYTSRCV